MRPRSSLQEVPLADLLRLASKPTPCAASLTFAEPRCAGAVDARRCGDMESDMMTRFATCAAWALLSFAAASVATGSARAETCPSAPGAQNTDKGAPATVGQDGVGGTGWTGGTGGLMAGVENEKKGQSPDAQNPDVAKGLDPTKGVTPGANDGKTATGPQPKC